MYRIILFKLLIDTKHRAASLRQQGYDTDNDTENTIIEQRRLLEHHQKLLQCTLRRCCQL